MGIVVADVETYSCANLPDVGAHTYAADPSTGVQFLCYAVGDGEVQTWRPGDPLPAAAFAAPDSTVVWDNWEFDVNIYRHVLVPRYGFPPIPMERQDCAQRLALANAFPAELGRRCEALGLPFTKDPAARRAMLRLARPDPAADPIKREHDLALLLERCKTDVASTRAAYTDPRFQPLAPEERRLLLLDAKINAAGICANVPFLTGAREIARQEIAAVNARLTELTRGEITSVGQVERIRTAVNARGHKLTKLNKRAVAASLAHDGDGFSRELLLLRQHGAHSSTAKFDTLLNFADPRDHRIRGVLRIHGSATGRWSSIGAQLHNLPRNDAEMPTALAATIASGDREALARHGEPLEIVKNLSRAALCAAPGQELICADFGSIESRVTAWLAGETWKLDLFRRYDESGDKDLEPYRVTACAILRKNVAPGTLSKAERQKGKYGELAFGFGGSVGAWKGIAGSDDSSDAEIKSFVDAWRAKHPKVVDFWYTLARAARTAICAPGRAIAAGKITASFNGTDLRLTLPSGRSINYPGAALVENAKFENAQRNIEFFDNARGKWARTSAWHGTLVENVVQGTARDLLRDALLRFDARGWKIVFHCHDEITVEAPTGTLDPQDVLACLLQAPEWAAGLPLSGSLHAGPLYLEDVTAGATAPLAPVADVTEEDDAAEEMPAAITVPAPPEAAVVSLAFGDGFDPHPKRKRLRMPPPDPPPDPPPVQHSNGYSRDDLEDDDEAPPWHSNGNGYARDDGGDGAEFIYRDAGGKPRIKVVKHVGDYGKKSFPTYLFEGDRWVKGGKVQERAIPYRLPELLAAPPESLVLICEGEKDVKTAVELGFVATCNPGGAGKWAPSLARWFDGASVAVLEDNDEAGRKHVEKVTTALTGKAKTIRVITFRDLPEHGDLTDWVQRGGTREQLLARIEAAPLCGALESNRTDDVELAAVDWIWPGRFARGKIGLLVGMPDEGKGQVISDIASRITRAAPWPCGEGIAPQGNVLLFTAEDDIADTVAPRLVAAGADLKRVHIAKMMHGAEGERMFSLVTDLGALRRKVQEIGEVVAVIVDPISAYLGIGKVDSFRATDVRAVLGPLKEMAAELNLLVLGVMHFNKKSDVTSVILRISDSLAYGATARHVYAVVDDAENQRKLFVKGKNNLAPAGQRTLAFTFAVREVSAAISAPHIVWASEPVDITATEAMTAVANNRSPGARDKAKELMRELLADGPAPSKTIFEAARENGVARHALRRAAEELGIRIAKDATANGPWLWSLPGGAEP